MNEDTVSGHWQQLAGKLMTTWGKLTDDEIAKAEGNREYLLGKLQEHYGLAKEKAEQHLKNLGFTASS